MVGIWRLKKLFRGIRNEWQILKQKYPVRVQCNICGWKGRQFSSDAWHPHTICPRCGSQIRHRLLFAALMSDIDRRFKEMIPGKRVLHFAPEPIIADYLKKTAGSYVDADLLRDDVDLRLDLSSMPGVADDSFDLVVACDVLEHVPDDSAALREIRRILKMDGWAILTVPQKDNLATTYQDASITTDEGRLQAFGQEDHLRIYGDDFEKILSAHGFEVISVDAHRFNATLVRHHVLLPPVLSRHPLASNHRKVFFGRKAAHTES